MHSARAPLVRGECLFSYLLLLAGACSLINPSAYTAHLLTMHQKPCSPDCC